MNGVVKSPSHGTEHHKNKTYENQQFQ